jgi:glycosyltransferase involved in cell wall biosynthesis
LIKDISLKTIYFTVTNDLTYDQRMIRIGHSLASNGYAVTLVGRTLPGSIPLKKELFAQKRLPCWFSRGKSFYLEFNTRLFFYLLFRKMDAVCAIDLDTILPCLFIARLKRIVRIYDAHELFSEMKEVLSRPAIKRIWDRLERYAVPRFVHGYTVSLSIADEFRKRYRSDFALIRNMPVLTAELAAPANLLLPGGLAPGERFILYQGAVNEARGLEFLLPAMRNIAGKLVICGDGNLMQPCKELVRREGLEDKVIFTGQIEPGRLRSITARAYIGLNLVEPIGLNQIYSLANKFFDYMHAAVPQVTMDFPEYRRINDEFAIGVLVDSLGEKKLADAINNLWQNDVLYRMLQDNCKQARLSYNWQEEEKKLFRFYQKIFN